MKDIDETRNFGFRGPSYGNQDKNSAQGRMHARAHRTHTHTYIYTHLLSLIKVMLNDNYNHASLKWNFLIFHFHHKLPKWIKKQWSLQNQETPKILASIRVNLTLKMKRGEKKLLSIIIQLIAQFFFKKIIGYFEGVGGAPKFLGQSFQMLMLIYTINVFLKILGSSMHVVLPLMKERDSNSSFSHK